MWSMIKGEFRHIIHNRLLLLSVTVICFIPFLYSIKISMGPVWKYTKLTGCGGK